MRIAAVFRIAGHYRFAEPIIRALIPGNEITLLLPDPDKLNDAQREGLKVEPVAAISPRTAKLRDLRDCAMHFMWVRSGLQNAEFIEHFYQHLPKEAVPRLRSLHKRGLSKPLAPFFMAYLKALDRLTPPDPAIVAHLKALQADLVFVCPGVYPSIQVGAEMDYLKAAQKLGLPTVMLVSSWDNLTSKSTFHFQPDKVLVWNKVQVQEAQRYHGLPESKVQAVGAAVFDKMFTKAHFEERASFCAQVGLDPSRPYVLWAGSSRAAQADERDVVEGLLSAMRRYPALEKHQLLVRPHPKFGEAFRKWTKPDVAIWKTPGFPDEDTATKGLYNCIAHAEAVAGLSTSVFLEAAVLDRPCALLSDSSFAAGSMYRRFAHFENLMTLGYPVVTQNEEDCARWLDEVARGMDENAPNRREFVRFFIRPNGLDKPAAQQAVAVIQEIVAAKRNR